MPQPVKAFTSQSPLKQKHIEREESPKGTRRYMLTLKPSLIIKLQSHKFDPFL